MQVSALPSTATPNQRKGGYGQRRRSRRHEGGGELEDEGRTEGDDPEDIQDFAEEIVGQPSR